MTGPADVSTLEGGAPGGELRPPAGEQAPTVYDIELEADAAELDAPSEVVPSSHPGEEGAPPAPSSPPQPPAAADGLQDLRARLEAAEATSRQLLSMLQPMAQGQPQAQDPPPVPYEKLTTDPHTTVQDIAQWVAWSQRQSERRSVQAQEQVAERILGQNRVRGVFTPESAGQGYDYDSIVSRYVEPMYRENPYIRQLVSLAGPDPAMAEYTVGSILEIMNRPEMQQDPVKAFRAVRAGLDAYTKGSRDTAKAITEAAEKGADQILGAGAEGAPKAPVKMGEGDIWKLSSKQFRELAERTGGI